MNYLFIYLFEQISEREKKKEAKKKKQQHRKSSFGCCVDSSDSSYFFFLHWLQCRIRAHIFHNVFGFGNLSERSFGSLCVFIFFFLVLLSVLVLFTLFRISIFFLFPSFFSIKYKTASYLIVGSFDVHSGIRARQHSHTFKWERKIIMKRQRNTAKRKIYQKKFLLLCLKFLAIEHFH